MESPYVIPTKAGMNKNEIITVYFDTLRSLPQADLFYPLYIAIPWTSRKRLTDWQRQIRGASCL